MDKHLVQVDMVPYHEGEEFYHDEHDLWLVELDEAAKPGHGTPSSGIMTRGNMGFTFAVLGEDDKMKEAIRTSSYEDVFGRFLPDIMRFSDQEAPRRVLTLWSNVDSKWDLIGKVDVQEITPSLT